MTKIVINRPPSPLPPLPRAWRKWRRREDWAAEPAERDPGPSVGETDGFVQRIRSLLGVPTQ